MKLPIVNIRQPVNWAHSLNRGLVGRWQNLPMGQWGGGTLWRDLGRKYDASITGAAWQGMTGKPGGFGSLSFNGTSNSALVSSTGYVAPPPFTVCCWFYAKRTGTGEGLVSHDSGANNGWRLINSASACLQLTFGAVASYTFSSVPVTLNAWNFACVAVTANGGTATAYGGTSGLAKQAITVGTITGTPSRILIASAPSGSTFFQGFLDDVRILNRAVSESEAWAIFNTSKSQFDPTLNWLQSAGVKTAGAVTLQQQLLALLGVGS